MNVQKYLSRAETISLDNGQRKDYKENVDDLYERGNQESDHESPSKTILKSLYFLLRTMGDHGIVLNWGEG